MDSSMVAEDRLVADRSIDIKPKMKFTGKVAKISLAGAMIEIGAGQPAVIHISQMVSPTNEPIKRVEDVMQLGQEVSVWVKRVKPDHIELTMVKPLDLEWRDLKAGMTVKGTVVRLEKFGAFVEIGAERPGLIHISEMAHGYVRTPGDVINEGDEIEAQVLDINRQKRQIKLSLKALQPEPVIEEEQKPVKPVEVQTPRSERIERNERTERSERGDKNRRQRKPRKSNSYDDVSGVVDSIESTGQVEPDPTAMELALREAMEKAKTRKQDLKAKKSRIVSSEQDAILSRTLEQKARS
jgi:small subunit ribosomal protein S1